MIPSSFRGYEVAAALVTLADTATASDVQIFDGPRIAEDLNDKFVVIGYSADGGTSIEAERILDDEDMCGRTTERGDVICFINCRSGNEDTALVRGQVHEIVTAIEEAVRENSTLGGVCDDLRIGRNLGSTYWQTSEGAQCALVFSIAYDAYI